MTGNIRLAAAALIALGIAPSPAGAQAPTEGFVRFTVRAGAHARHQTPIHFEIPEARFGAEARLALANLVPLRVSDGDGKATRSLAEAQYQGIGRDVRINLLLPDDLAAGAEASYRIDVRAPAESRPVWTMDESRPGALEIKNRGRLVFRYNAAPVSSPNYGPIQNRDAYIHPAYTPSGALVTGDFSPSHPHHRGFFLAYVHTKTGNLTPDFWNIHTGSGKIHADGMDYGPDAGIVTGPFHASHRWMARDKAKDTDRLVLRERWEVAAYDIPGSPYWLIDITSIQRAVGQPLELLPYRYGGMAYRGPEPFVKGTLDVLTSAGLHRRDGDQKPARWVDLTGPIADGSDKYAGAMIADHPGNPHAPTVARIHPTTLPFFSFVPAYDTGLTLAVDAPTTFRYRVLIHDGHPDAALNERIYRDFAEPPAVVVAP